MFLTTQPSDEVPDLCLETFGMTTTTSTTSQPWYNPSGWFGR